MGVISYTPSLRAAARIRNAADTHERHLAGSFSKSINQQSPKSQDGSPPNSPKSQGGSISESFYFVAAPGEKLEPKTISSLLSGLEANHFGWFENNDFQKLVKNSGLEESTQKLLTDVTRYEGWFLKAAFTSLLLGKQGRYERACSLLKGLIVELEDRLTVIENKINAIKAKQEKEKAKQLKDQRTLEKLQVDTPEDSLAASHKVDMPLVPCKYTPNICKEHPEENDSPEKGIDNSYYGPRQQYAPLAVISDSRSVSSTLSEPPSPTSTNEIHGLQSDWTAANMQMNILQLLLDFYKAQAAQQAGQDPATVRDGKKDAQETSSADDSTNQLWQRLYAQYTERHHNQQEALIPLTG